MNIAFLWPDVSYSAGSLDISNSGLQFSYDGTVLKQAIKTLKSKNPDTKVFISVGGGDANARWASLNEKAVSNFFNDFGLDGVDIDYEPPTPSCSLNNNRIACATDKNYQAYVSRIRAALPAYALVSMAVNGFGCYGEPPYDQVPPVGSDENGQLVNLLRSSAADGIDLLNVMSYDAGPVLDATQSLSAHMHYFSKKVTLGVETQNEGAGNHALTSSTLR